MDDRIKAEVAACQLDAALTDKQVGELRQARAFWDACDSSEPLPFPSDEREILTQFEKHVRAALEALCKMHPLRGAGLLADFYSSAPARKPRFVGTTIKESLSATSWPLFKKPTSKHSRAMLSGRRTQLKPRSSLQKSAHENLNKISALLEPCRRQRLASTRRSATGTISRNQESVPLRLAARLWLTLDTFNYEVSKWASISSFRRRPPSW